MEEGISAKTGQLWSRAALDEAIRNDAHASACAPDMVSFIQRDLLRREQDGFIILLSAQDSMKLFRENLNTSHIAAVLQDQRHPHLILNLLAQPNKDTTSVNNTKNRYTAPDKMQFGRA